MKIHHSVLEEFEELAEGHRGAAEVQIDMDRRALEMCQSPMEQLFLINVIMLWSGETIFVSDDFVHIIVRDEFDGFMTIRPQASIPIGGHRYNADFLMEYKTRHPYREQFKVVVEIDGHNYHERTKGQAKHDKQRDRLMTMGGYTVFRFTGSEIYHDAARAVMELGDHLYKWQEQIFVERGLTH